MNVFRQCDMNVGGQCDMNVGGQCDMNVGGQCDTTRQGVLIGQQWAGCTYRPAVGRVYL